LEVMRLTIQKLADHLHMTRASLSRVINGHASMSIELAVKLELAGFSKAKFWLDMQTNYNLWQTMQQAQPPISPLVSASPQTPL
ncbi:HigA family addiction module antitoxin, partial [Bartonella taylorii]|uniref:HigA family addiction module antitoxin n=1 Tax=Bartonella taylorii TaxID=33046 RepID=UPI001ABBA83D